MSTKIDTNDRVRVQVQVEETYAKKLNELSEVLDRSVSWIGAELVKDRLLDHDNFVEWIAGQVLSAVTAPVRGWKRKTGGSKVTVQLLVEQPTALRVERLAERLNLSTSKVAALLLESAIHSQGWLIKFVNSNWGHRFVEPFEELMKIWFGDHNKLEKSKDLECAKRTQTDIDLESEHRAA
ncbi:hypothetical protein [Stratiformator vulcanicus]|uniref:Ribbon-helix-helix protein, copG family n=1 Tax=Stratiformator vulcanicus TaxID=2527980 RepID=A0A517R6A8_9PLAN|nr:hypothetical protein [Stratiformator vulcanicus]QDT39373.1 Ribbon-helix-helix protein, copG family [Stratiformator vulcanicus]